MPLEIPEIEDRDYQEILNEALVRISVHNPEWTNFNDSDPGVTLIQISCRCGGRSAASLNSLLTLPS